MKHLSLPFKILLVISVFFCTPLAQAGETPEITITEGMDFDLVELYNLEYIIDGFTYPSIFPPTRVDMTGGHVGDETDGSSGMYTYESSTFNISGGTVDYLNTYGTSTSNISGGTVSNYECSETETITANDYSTINIYDGAHLDGWSFHFFNLYDSSTVNIYGGNVALFLHASNYSTVNMYDGDCDYGIIPLDYSITNVYGGYIDVYWYNYSVPETATVNIYGHSFNYDPNAQWSYWEDPCDGWWVSKLTGSGCEGTAIEYWGLPDPNTHANINLIPDFIPARGVNLADFAVFASAWKTQQGDAKWNHICDVSDPNDNVIDERDLAVLTKYWSAGIE